MRLNSRLGGKHLQPHLICDIVSIKVNYCFRRFTFLSIREITRHVSFRELPTSSTSVVLIKSYSHSKKYWTVSVVIDTLPVTMYIMKNISRGISVEKYFSGRPDVNTGSQLDIGSPNLEDGIPRVASTPPLDKPTPMTATEELRDTLADLDAILATRPQVRLASSLNKAKKKGKEEE